MVGSRRVIVNADDFGQSHGINRGVIEAHQRGIVTSTSLMVRWPAAVEAGTYARGHTDLGLGLHFDLGEWACRAGAWRPVYKVVRPGDRVAVEAELARQLADFRTLVGREPSHIDSHQHAHLREPVRSVLLAVAHDLGVPLRRCNDRVHYVGDFYGQTADGAPLPEAITRSGLVRLLTELPAGVSEIGCHPGYVDDLDTMYREERAQEVAVLCDPAVRDTVGAMGIVLTSFAALDGQ
ncbi:MAG: hypothetical protein DME09_07225 [Candidatus Rokuibacteriota bacterium]|nr:MAG: hypothetical protein DME09_07225 [Candidatus Rokubacteria bacterium]